MNHDELQNLIGRLRSACNDKDNFPRMDSELCVNAKTAKEAADELEEILKLLEKQQKIIRRIYVDHFPDTYFVCGESGSKDQNGLPDRIEVCPAYGVDWSQIYERTDRQIGGMGS
jgi:hypothetical protein